MARREPRDSSVGPSRLPAEVASFIGREREVGELEDLLANARLLTITGVGGSGKTRLAVRVATARAAGYPDGAWFVALAPVRDSALVAWAVAAALGEPIAPGRPPLASLATSLAARRLLLILDNCEHLIAACATLAETLLRACPQLQILATSREPLRIPGEVVWRAPALAIPDDGAPPALEDFARIESVTLFRERAWARRRDFAITSENAATLATICRQLAGLPLAIELAAGQVGALSLDQIATRLGDALKILGGGSRTEPRQETLRAALDWSHDLLDAEQRALFRRLAVFSGGFDVEAVEAVGAAETGKVRALPILLTLAEKSLVESQVHPQGARYHLLEPVRQYAWERLAESGEVEATQRRHAHHFADRAEAAMPGLMSGERAPWMARLAADRDNLRAALTWSRYDATPDALDVGLRIAFGLGWDWTIRGAVSEALEWFEALLARSQAADPERRIRAVYFSGELCWVAGRHDLARARLTEAANYWRSTDERRWLAYALQSLAVLSGPEAGEALARESLALFEEVDDQWGCAHAAFSLAMLALQRGATDTRDLLEETLARWRALGDAWGMAQTLNFLGDLARGEGADSRAARCYAESLDLLRQQGLTGTVPSLLHNLGALALRRGETRQAMRLFREALVLFRDQGDQRGIAECLLGIAGALAVGRAPIRAARLIGAAEALLAQTGASAWGINQADNERTRTLIRAEADAESLAAAFAVGRVIPLEQIIVEALERYVAPLAATRGVRGLSRQAFALIVAVALLVVALGVAGVVYTLRAGVGSFSALPAPTPTVTPIVTRTPSLVTVIQDPLTQLVTYAGDPPAWQQNITKQCEFTASGYQEQGGGKPGYFSLCSGPAITEAGDERITVTMRLTRDGDSHGLYGLIFHSSGDLANDGYAVVISPTGQWALLNFGTGQTLAKGTNSAIHTGLGAVNTLTVDSYGATITISVNGARIGQATTSAASAGQLTFAVEHGLAVVYTNLTVARYQ